MAMLIVCRFPPANARPIFSKSEFNGTVRTACLLGEYTDICNDIHNVKLIDKVTL